MPECPDCRSLNLQAKVELRRTGETRYSRSPIRIETCPDCGRVDETDMAVGR